MGMLSLPTSPLLAQNQKKNTKKKSDDAEKKPAMPLSSGITMTLEHSWSPINRAKSYEVLIEIRTPQGQYREFSPPIPNETNKFSQQLPYGTYRIKYRPIYSATRKGRWSKPKRFAAIFPEIIVLSPKEKDMISSRGKKAALATFEWDAHENVGSYALVLEMVKPKKGKPKVIKTAETTLKTRLPANSVFRWRVEANTSYKPKKPAPWRILQITKKPPLGNIKFTVKTPDIVIWKPVKNAEFFQVDLYFFEDEQWVKKKTRRLKARPKKKARFKSSSKVFGKYKIEVQAKAKGTAPSQVATYEFERAPPPPDREDTLANMKAVNIEDDLPPTRNHLVLYGSYGGETLDTKGVIGEFKGEGATSGGGFIFETLPRPEATMILILMKVESETFETISEKSVDDNLATEQFNIQNNRIHANFSVYGRSNLTNEFWGFGLGLFEHGTPKFVILDENTGEGKLKTDNIVGISPSFHHRFKIFGGSLMSYLSIAPFSSSTQSFLMVEAIQRWRLLFTNSLAVELGYTIRYIDTQIQKECSLNQEGECKIPVTKSTYSGVTLGMSWEM